VEKEKGRRGKFLKKKGGKVEGRREKHLKRDGR
jgi:hypothetical protein